MDLYPACAEELYYDVVIILCNSSFIPVLYGFVPLETGIARDSRFLGLSRRCRDTGFRSRKFGSFHVEIKRTAHIRCGGHVPTGAIASRNPVKEENIPTPVRRSARIRGMKRKDYKEVSPEPKDYGDSDYSDDCSPSSWAAARRDDNDLYIWEEVPRKNSLRPQR
jgi:hypothetical protein